MAISWRKVKPLKTSSAIENFKKEYNFSIPADLEECILSNNGGRPSPKVLCNKKGDEYEVKALLSFNDDDAENIYNVIDFFVEKYSFSMLPFAKDSGDNYYCLKNGKVIYWSQDMEEKYVCDSFNEFITLLENGK